MLAGDQEISTRLVVILLVPVVTAALLVGYVIVDGLSASQPPAGGPDATIVFQDHPDYINRSAPGEGIVIGRLEGDESLNWSTIVVEVVNPRTDSVIVSLSDPRWTTHGAGQTIELHVDGTKPASDGSLAPGEVFVLRDVRDDRDASADLVSACSSFEFRARHVPTETILGTYEITFVPPDWVPGGGCD